MNFFTKNEKRRHEVKYEEIKSKIAEEKEIEIKNGIITTHVEVMLSLDGYAVIPENDGYIVRKV